MTFFYAIVIVRGIYLIINMLYMPPERLKPEYCPLKAEIGACKTCIIR